MTPTLRRDRRTASDELMQLTARENSLVRHVDERTELIWWAALEGYRPLLAVIACPPAVKHMLKVAARLPLLRAVPGSVAGHRAVRLE